MTMPSSSLAGRRALICGASAGIGQATARVFVAAGAQVVLLARSADKLQSLAAELGPAAGVLTLDLQDLAAVSAAARRLLEDGDVHIVVNNTGGPKGGPLIHAGVDEFEAAFRRHVLASHLLVQGLLPGMVESGYGRILNVISTSVYEPIPNLGVSNTIRGAMASWSKSLSRELPPGITINNVLPGFTDTPRLEALGRGRASREGKSLDAVREAWVAQVPEGRLAQPEETAAMLAFLASPAAAYIRGQSIAVDGGRLRSI